MKKGDIPLPDNLPVVYAPGTLGPAMAALTERQRRFVLVYVESGDTNATRVAMKAGYGRTYASTRVAGCLTMQNPKVKTAIQEECRRRLDMMGPVGLMALSQIAADPCHKDRLKAAEMILNRVGLNAVSEHRVIVDNIGDREMIEYLRERAKQEGRPDDAFLGGKDVGALLEGRYEEIIGPEEEITGEDLEMEDFSKPQMEGWDYDTYSKT